MKKLNSILALSFLFVLGACDQVPTSSSNQQATINQITAILKDGVEVNEINVLVNEEITLTPKLSDEAEVSLKWESSNTEIATISNEGKLTALKKGTAIITVSLSDLPYIKKSIFVNVKEKVIQTGVGTGATSDNAIYLGNEGEDEPLQIYFLEMQHIYADCLYIKKGNVDILIDSGWAYDGSYVSTFLEEKMTDEILDVLMVSHSDGDHIDGMQNALSNVDNISLMVDYGGQGNAFIKNIRNNYKQKGMVYHSAYDCANLLNGAFSRYYLTKDLYFDVLDTGNYVQADASSAGNAHSLAVIFYYKDFKFFTAGDLTSSSEADLLKNEDLPEVTLYKASHHASSGSNSQELLDTLNPKAVAVSAARANNYSDTPSGPKKDYTYNLDASKGSHPSNKALERIYKAPNISQNLNVFWNAVNGTMKFETYGDDDFTFQGSPTRKGYYDLSLTDGLPVWNEEKQDFENKVTGEDNFRFHETKAFTNRGCIYTLPDWAQKEFYPDYK